MQKIQGWIKVAVITFSIAGAATAIAACNTVEGIGEDVQATGKGIENGAQKAN